MQHLVRRANLEDAIAVDSAGTAAYHAGERADHRSRATAMERGIAITSIARQFVESDFSDFDYVLAMDQANLDQLASLCPDDDAREKLFLMRSFDSRSEAAASVPDPYYGGAGGFDDVFDICQAACEGLLSHLKKVHRLGE